MSYTNSSMVSYKLLSPNNSGTRTHAIDRITIHCTAFQCSVETLGLLFYNGGVRDPKKGASSNYGVGYDGRIGMYCPESTRSWCTSSSANDQRAITIEVSTANDDPYYTVNDKAYAATLDLVEDICRRNGKKKLIWFGDKGKSINYEPKDDEMVMTVHRWFANKSCPGECLYNRQGDIAKEITERLSKKEKTTCKVEMPVLRLNDKCGFVKTMQILLNKYIHSKLTEDGSFGPLTEKEVKRYQSIVGYPQTGVCDGKMWWHLLK